MQIPPLLLERIIANEDIIVIAHDTVHLPGDFSPAADRDFIDHTGSRFLLEKGDTVRTLFDYYIDQSAKELEEMAFLSFGSQIHPGKYAEYFAENILLEQILLLFQRLKPHIGYAQYLKMDQYAPARMVDADELEQIFRSTVVDPTALEDDTITTKLLETGFLGVDQAIFLQGVGFALAQHRSKKIPDITVNLDGRLYCPGTEVFTGDEYLEPERERITSVLSRHVQSGSLEERHARAQKKRFYLQQKFTEGNFVSQGLVLERIGPKVYTISMVLPKYYVKVPDKSYYVRFRQASLSTTISISNQSRTPTITYTPVLYSIPEQHPLIYPEGYKKHGQVCLREYEQELEEQQGKGFAEKIGAHFLLGKQVLFYGSNMVNTIDPATAITSGSLNPHRITRRKFSYQRVQQPPEKALVIEEFKGD